MGTGEGWKEVNIQSGQLVATGAGAVLAGFRMPGPYTWRDERRDMDRKSRYAEKLLDPRWQKKRLEVLNRDDWTCQVCRSKTKTLHVHHAAYAPYGGDPWDASSDAIFTICAECHEGIHEEQQASVHLLLAMLGSVNIRTPEDISLLEETASIALWQSVNGPELKRAATLDDRIESICRSFHIFAKMKADRIEDQESAAND